MRPLYYEWLCFGFILMVHTSGMLRLARRTVGGAGLGIMLAGLACAATDGWAQSSRAAQCATHTGPGWRKAIDHAALARPDARTLVVEIASGRVLASAHLAEAGRTQATPGSTLKPLILYFAIASGRWDAEHRVACSRQLHIGGHQLNCSHPAAQPMDAQQALTWSCNSYFAELAGMLKPDELRRALSERGLLGATGLTQQESVAAFRLPRNREEVQLAALGIEGIRVTLPELTEAYRSLAVEMAAHPDTRAAQTVRAGLVDSASFGMAGAAALGGVAVAGKTGTASAENGGATHGWFVGLAPADSPQVVVAVYLPAGRGADAAQVAGSLLAHSPLRKP
jgi:cell division protein FtsI/penicillin-binding protein 2